MKHITDFYLFENNSEYIASGYNIQETEHILRSTFEDENEQKYIIYKLWQQILI